MAVAEKQKSLTEIFLEVAQPDEEGFSREVPIEELIAIDERFRTNNGCNWARSDGPLGKKYHVDRPLENGRVAAIKLNGFNQNPSEKSIRSDIFTAVKSRKCAVLATGNNIECDHKNGRYDSRTVASLETQRQEDFQPLSKAANDAKRQHCKTCKKNHHRFDAKRLGYHESYIKGDAKTNICQGCYWYDPYAFNRAMSEHFQKKL